MPKPKPTSLVKVLNALGSTTNRVFFAVLWAVLLTPVILYTRTRGCAARAVRAIAHAGLGRVLAVMMVLTAIAAVGGAQFFNLGQANAATSDTLNFQARLENINGGIANDGNYNVEFKLYNTATGGTELWSEAYTYLGAGAGQDKRIRVENGYLTANLGSINPFPNTINWAQDLYITMNVGGRLTTATWDGEMNPRLKLTAVPYAFSAGNLATTANGFVSTLTFTAPTANNSIVLPNQSGTVCLANTTECGFASANGTSGAYIQNNSSLQTTANFNIQSAGAGTVTAAIQALTGQTADLLNFRDMNGDNLSGFNVSGQLFYQSGSFTGTLVQDTLSQNTTYILPGIVGGTGSATICLTTGNCAGAGGGITGSGMTNYVARFNSNNTINQSSLLYDNGLLIGVGTTAGPALLNVVATNASQAGIYVESVANATAPIAAFRQGLNQSGALLQVRNAADTASFFAVTDTGTQLGTAGSIAGTLIFANTDNTQTTTLIAEAPTGTGNVTYRLPTATGGSSYYLCTNQGNCAGAGGGITGAGATNYIARFNSPSTINQSSLLYDDGNFVGVNTISNAGLLSIVGSSAGQSSLFVQGSAAATAPTLVLKQGTGQTSNLLELSDEDDTLVLSVGPNGDTDIGGTLGVTGLTTLSGGLSVSSGATIVGGLTATGAINLNTTGSANTAIGNATGSFTLTSSGLNVSAAGALSGITTLTTSGDVTLGGALDVTGATTLGDTLTVTGLLTADGGITISGANTFTTGTGAVTLSGRGAGVVTTDASGVVSSGAIDRNSSTYFTNALGTANGGTGLSSFTANGVLFADTASSLAQTTGTSGQFLQANGTGVPTFVTASGDATIAVGGAITIANNAITTAKILNGTIINEDLAVGSFTNITGVGALSEGSITSGFGTIATTNNISTTATVEGATVNATTGFTLNGTDINTAGTLTNVAYLNQANTFSAANTFNATGTALTVTNDASIGGTATVGTLSVTTSATIGNGLTVAAGGLTVTAGATSLGGTLAVTGTSTFTGAITASGGLTIDNNANFAQTGTGTFSTGTGAVSLNGATTVASTLTVTGVNGDGVSGIFTGRVSGAQAVEDDEFVTLFQLENAANPDNYILNGTDPQTADFNITGSGTIGTLAVTSSATIGNGLTVTAGGLTVTAGATSLAGTLAVTGTSTFTGAITANGGLTIGGASTFTTGTGTITFSGRGAGVVTTDASGVVSSGAIDRNSSTYFSNTLSTANGGTGLSSFTANGVLFASNANTLTQATGTAGQLLQADATGTPTFVTASGDASIAVGGAITINNNAITSAKILNGTIVNEDLAVGSFTNITGVGALTTGSIASGFGTISTTNDITTTAALNGGALTVTGLSTLAATNITGAAAINTTGTANTAIGNSTGTFSVTSNALNISSAGAISGVTTFSASGLTSLTGGLTATGNILLNTTGTGNTAIGNATGTFSLASSGLNVSTAGAVSGVTTLAASGAITASTTNTINGLSINAGALSTITGYSQTSGNFDITGTGTFSTGTGTISLNGATTIGSTLTVTGTNGTGYSGAFTGKVSGVGGTGANDFVTYTQLADVTGGGNYIQNIKPSSLTPQNGNFFVQSDDVATAATAAIRADVGQTGDLLQFQDSTGARIAGITFAGSLDALNGDFDGTLTVAGASTFNGTSTFNGAVSISGTNTLTVGTGATVLGGTLSVAGNAAFDTTTLVVDATNDRVGVGRTVSATGSLLQIGTNTNTAAGGIQFGTDASATLYRFASNTLAVGGAFYVGGNLTLSNGNLQTTQTTANLLTNATTATTVNFATQATTLSVGAATGTTTINNNLTVGGTGAFTTGTGAVTLSGRGAGLVVTNGSGVVSTGAVDRNSSTYFNTTLSTANGGTGLTTYTANGVLFASNSSTLTQTAGTSGQFLQANASNVPGFVTASGDVTLAAGGAFTIANSAVTSIKIADGTIVNADLAAGSFTNITGVGALAEGSITNGFGTITTDNNITTSAVIQGGTFTNTGGTFAVDANGTITTTLSATTGGNLVCRNASNQLATCTNTYAQTNDTTNFIRNQQTAQSGNFNVFAATGVAGVLRGASGEDIAQFQNNAGTVVARFDANGNLTASNGTFTGNLSVNGTSSFTGAATFDGGITVQNNSNFSQTGTGTFSTGTGNVDLNGITVVKGTNSFSVEGGNSGFGAPADTNFRVLINGGNNGLGVVGTSAPSATSGAGIQGFISTAPNAAGQRLGFYTLGVRSGGTSYNSASIEAFSNQAYSLGSAQGTYLTLSTTPDGSATRQTRLTVAANGNIGIGNAGANGLLSVGSTAQFQVSTTGAVTAVGVNSGTGQIQGTGGLNVTGATTINTSGTGSTTIGSNNSNTQVTLQNNAASSLVLSTTGTSITGTLGVSGLITANGGITISGANTFTTGTGQIQFSGRGTGIVTTNATGVVSSGAVDRNSTDYFTNTLSTGNGGTGLTTYTANGVLFASNTSTLTQTAGTSGQFLQANASNVPGFVTASGDVTLAAGGAFTIANSAVTSIKIADGTIVNADLAAGSFTNITGVGALSEGSITTGFGTISTANTITTTAAMQAGTFTNTGSTFQVNAAGNVTTVLSATTGTTLVCQNASNQLAGCTNTYAQTNDTTNFIRNQTTAQTGNFNVFASTGVAGVLRGAAGQDIAQFQNNATGAVVARFDASGNLTANNGSFNGTLAVTGGATFSGGVTINNNGNFEQTGSGTFSTGTGNVTFNGPTNVAAGNNFSVTNGNSGFGAGSDSIFRVLISGSNPSGLAVVNSAAASATAGAGIQGFTSSTPTAAGQRLGFFTLGVRNGTTAYNPVGIEAFSNQAYSLGSAQGAYLAFSTTPDGSATRQTRLTIAANGNVGVGNAGAAGLLSVGSTGQFQVSSAGAVTAVGVNSGTGQIQGTGGLSVSGTTTINGVGSTSATTIGSNNSNTQVTLQNNSASSLTVNTGGTAIAGTLSTSGLLTANGGITISGTNTFTTGTGQIQFSGRGAGLVTTNASGVVSSGTIDRNSTTYFTADALEVANGGTGLTAFTANSILYAGSTSSVAQVAGTSGQILQANGSGVPDFVSFSGDITVAVGGAVTIANSAVTSAKIADNTIVNADLATGSFTKITGVGALTAGSLTTGFGTINIGSNITTSAQIQGGTLRNTNGSFAVDAAGAVTAVGVDSGTGLIQGTGGATITGTTQINTSGTAATTIGSATTNTAVTLQNGANSRINVNTTGTAVTGTLSASGLLSANAGLTVAAGQNLTVNSEAFSDLTGSGLTLVSGALTVDATSATGFFRNGGNSFTGGTATLGTNDANALIFETTGTGRMTIAANGNVGIGNNGATGLLSVGASAEFQVASNGVLTVTGVNGTGYSAAFTGRVSGADAVEDTDFVTYQQLGAVTGGGNYITNQTTPQTDANFNIVARTGTVAARIQGAAGQDITQFANSGGTTVASISSTGALTAVGVNSGTGLIQGTGGATITGTTQINTSGTAATTIGSATTNTTVTLQNNAASSFVVNTTGSVVTGTLSVTGNTGLGGASNALFRVTVQSAGTNGLAVVNSQAASAAAGAGIQGLTSSIPTAAGQRLGFFTLGATNGTSVANSVAVEGFANQAFTLGSAEGSYLVLSTTANGAATRTERLRVTSDGNIGIGNSGATGMLSVGATAQFQVSSTGALTAVGVNSGTGLIQGAGGATVTGTTQINTSGTASTTIGSATTNTTVTLQNNAASNLVINTTGTAITGTLSVTGLASFNGAAVITTPAAGTVGLIVNGAVGQTADLFQVTRNGAASAALAVNNNGRTFARNGISVGGFPNSSSTIVGAQATAVGDTVADFRQFSAGQTADLLKFTNAGGTTLSSFNAAGNLLFNQNGSISATQIASSAAGYTIGITAGQGGAGANNGGDLTLDGGAATGGATKGSVVLQGTGGITSVGGTLSVTGLATFNGGVTIETGDTFTINGDALTDLTGNGLVVTSGALTVDSSSTAGFFRNGGNTFAGASTIGNINNNDLSIITNNQTRLTVTAAGNVGLGNAGTFGMFSVGTTGQFNVSSAGALVAVGVNSGTGLLQGAGGITVTGTADINTTGTAATTIGNSGAALTIQGNGATVNTSVFGTRVSGDAQKRLDILANGQILFGDGTSPATVSVAYGGSNTLSVVGGIFAAGNIRLDGSTDRVIDVAQAASGNGRQLLVAAGQGAASNGAGGVLALQGGSGGGTNQNGGDVTISGGANTGTGSRGNVLLQADGGFVGIGAVTTGVKLNVEDTVANMAVIVKVKNQAGNGFSEFVAENNSGYQVYLGIGGVSAADPVFANRAYLDAGGNVAGLNLMASDANGDLRVYTGGASDANERLRVEADGDGRFYGRLAVGSGGYATTYDSVPDDTSGYNIVIEGNESATVGVLAVNSDAFGDSRFAVQNNQLDRGFFGIGSDGVGFAQNRRTFLQSQDGNPNGSGGLSLIAEGTNNDIRFFTGGDAASNERLNISNTGIATFQTGQIVSGAGVALSLSGSSTAAASGTGSAVNVLGGNATGTTSTGGAVNIRGGTGTSTNGAVNIGLTTTSAINIGSSETALSIQGNGATVNTSVFGVRVSGNANDRLNVQANGQINFGDGTAVSDLSISRGGSNTLAVSGNIQLATGATRTINIAQSTTGNGNQLTIAGGNGATSAGAAQVGGVLALQGGAAGGTDQNGGAVTIDGGVASGTGGFKGTITLQGDGNGTVAIGGAATGNRLSVYGDQQITGATTANSRLYINGVATSSSSAQYGLQNQAEFAPSGAGPIGGVYGLINIPKLTGSAAAVNDFMGATSRLDTSATFTGQIANGYTFRALNPDLQGSPVSGNKITTTVQYMAEGITTTGGNTSGTVANASFRGLANTASAGAGGTLLNLGLDINVGTGSGAGTTTNYGIRIQGAGGTLNGTTTNYALYSSSTANSYMAGNLGINNLTQNNYKLSVNVPTTTTNLANSAAVISGSGDNRVLVVQGSSAQSTANILEVQSSAGATLASVSAAGVVLGASDFVSNVGVFRSPNPASGVSTGVTLRSGNVVANTNSGSVTVDSGTVSGSGVGGAVNIGTVSSRAITLGNTNASTVTTFNAGAYGVIVGNTGLQINSTAAAGTADILFGNTFNRTISIQQAAVGTAGKNLTLQAGAGNTTGAGGSLILQAAAGGASGASGNVIARASNATTQNFFQIQSSANAMLFGADTTTGNFRINIGAIGAPVLTASTGNGDLRVAGTAEIFGSTFIGTGTGGVLFASTGTNAYEPILSGTARHYKSVGFVPEFPGATMFGTGIGTMTSDFCSNNGAFVVNATACNTANDQHNYYQWTTTQATAQAYDIYTRWQVPSDFDGFNSNAGINNMSFTSWGTSGAAQIAAVTVYNGSTACNTATNVTGTGVWVNTNIATLSCGTIVPGSTILTIRIHVEAGTNNIQRIGEMNINYLGKH